MIEIVRKIANVRKIIADLDREIKEEIERQARGWSGE